ncbi:hypothetical protein MJO28_004563 [Puccinia striiformis f. sp. tritici]|nr:hypothetical protein MJO28_004563 [Puccinia striiformis f. sp. tritici]KAI7963300.1 hypothetical protein MJO29_003727 [Puccinia striiformis f. sp. tritici]KAI9608850.1 hypothetical protein H4Q26_005039 [Puccinia striiformis f. sp. tritici PST-130]KNE96373.1 hypothetical protein PSTG_10339 [Puccinia striiformis f. sp. tritici PST-78]
MRYTSLPRTATFAWSPGPLLSSSQNQSSSASNNSNSEQQAEQDPFNSPLLATGTASGVLDSSFSTDSKLEIWSPFTNDSAESKGSVVLESRFHRLAWGHAAGLRSRGVIAAGMENAELDIWDPVKILAGEGREKALVSKMKNHNGPVKGLDFNPVKNNLLASGASKGEVFIWDLNNPIKPFAPPSSRSLDDVTSVNWNHIVQSVLAASSNNGYTVVWDIREANGQKGREVATLSYSGASNQMPAYGQPQPGMMGGPQYGSQWMGPAGGRPGSVSSVVWHPENPTKLVTASDDDASPIVLVWDLRNARAPERILAGHEKGILSLAWCKQDPDLLVSCGKDCRTICWNPSSGEIVAELPPSSNWSFQSDWCPRNPDLIATASFDGRIAINSLQSTGEESDNAQPPLNAGPPIDGSDIFGDQGILALNSAKAAVSCKQAPKWYKRPSAATFAFGGKMVTISNPTPPNPAQQTPTDSISTNTTPVVNIRQVVTEPTLVERALKLENASQARNLQDLCEERVNLLPSHATTIELQSWKLLSTLFKTDSSEELVNLLGFSKSEVKSMVERQIESYKPSRVSNALSRTASEMGPTSIALETSQSDNDSIPREPLVTFADTPREGLSASSEGGCEATVSSADAPPSEASVSAISDGTKLAEAESEITEPSLFGDDNANAAGQTAASVDFYNSMRGNRPAGLPDHVFSRVSAAASSVGATVGSQTSSIASETTRNNTFQIYPSEESKGDRLITRALVVGDFESAVSLCITSERWADALLLGVRGGPELLQKAQKAYFSKQTINHPYLRLYQSIVLDDLMDVVQNAELSEWQEIFVVLCTFAKKEEFSNLVEQLGQRLEYMSHPSTPTESPDQHPPLISTAEFRKNAILCYLAAGKLEKVTSIWIEQMQEEEAALLKNIDADDHKSAFTIHAEVLQTLIEKVTVFQSAINYVDLDLAQINESAEATKTDAKEYKLCMLYDCYCEYAELLASQGLSNTALKFVAQTPMGYNPSRTSPSTSTRERLSKSAGLTSITTDRHFPPEQKTPTSTSIVPPLDKPFAEVPSTQNAYQNSYNQTNNLSAYSNSAYNQPSTMGAPGGNMDNNYSNPYGSSSYGQMPMNQNSYAPMTAGSFLPPPPAPIGTSPIPSRAPSVSQPPPTSRQNASQGGGWNDAPVVNNARKNLPAPGGPKAVISSPFPNVPQINSPAQPYPNQFSGYGAPQTGYQQGSPGGPPPPPRGGSRTPGNAGNVAPPPPKFGQQPPGGVPQTPQQYGQAGQYGHRSNSIDQPPSNVGPYGPQGGNMASASGPPGPYGPPKAQHPGAGPPAPPRQVNFSTPTQQVAYQSQPVMQSPMQQTPYGGGPPQIYPQQRGSISGGQAAGPYGIPPSGPGMPPGQGQSQLGNMMKPGGFSNPNNDPQRPGTTPTATKPEPPKSKYPSGDRTHIPEASKPIYVSLQRLMNQMKQGLPANQKKLVDDTERRLNVLFDGLNCETVPLSVIDELTDIVKAIEARNLQLALQLHVSLLTSGIKSDELTTYMPAIKMLIAKLQ